MVVQKLSSKNQIVIPKEARQAMGVKGGDESLVVVKDGLTLVMPKPSSIRVRCADWPKGTIRRLFEARATVVVGGASARALPAEHERIGLDTNVFMYFLEDYPRYGARCASLFERIERGYNQAVTSTVTLLELLAQSYREQKEELARKIFALISHNAARFYGNDRSL